MSEAHAGRGAQGRVGTAINGKWQVDARIGTGGMATVYSATHRNGQRVALKMLHAPLSRDPSTKARFLREGYVANAVGHPGVVAVLDDGVAEDGSVFLVLELLEGETIDARRVRLGGRLPVDEVLDLADQALAALAAAHEKGIVHRDVKPENVFLTNDGQIKLLDFGLARMKDSQAEATKTGVTIGTPEFMPPEQARGRRDSVDARSDVWGLGATLFNALTGRYVHENAQSLHEQLIASATRRPEPIRQFAPHVPASVGRVIDRALELEMSDRWQSASEMRAALRAARGPRTGEFAGDSMTLAATSALTPNFPFAVNKRPQAFDDVTTDERGLSNASNAPNAIPARARPRTMEDATDMEETYVDDGSVGATLKSQGGASALRRPAGPLPAIPTPRRLGSAPPPQPARLDSRPPAAPFPRMLETPPTGMEPTVRAVAHHRPLRVEDAHAPTLASQGAYSRDGTLASTGSPAGYTDELGPTMASPRGAPVEAPGTLSPRAAPVDGYGQTFVSPGAFRASTPPPGYGPPPHPHQVPRSGPSLGPPGPPPMMGEPTSWLGGGRGSPRAIIFISLILIIVCAAMGAYVLSQGAFPAPVR